MGWPPLAASASMRARHERQRDLTELDAFELGEQAVAEHLRGDAGAVGQEEHRPPLARPVAHGDKILWQCESLGFVIFA
jgi:hypothetical protein